MNIPLTLTHMRPSEEWTLDGDGYEGLTWLSETPKPTEAEIKAAEPAALAAAVDAEAVKVAARESAIAKLSALGLNIDEVNAIVGSI